MEEHKVKYFQGLVQTANHKVWKLVHSAKCKFYTEGIALASSSNELHQIVNTLSNRHLPRILPTIYPSADLPSIFIKHITNKVGGRRQDGKKERMMRNSDHSWGDSTFGKKDIRRSTGSTSRKRVGRIQLMLKSHCSLADGMAIGLYK